MPHRNFGLATPASVAPDQSLQSANVGCASADDARALAGAGMGEPGVERESALEAAYAIAANPRPDAQALFKFVGKVIKSGERPEFTMGDLSLKLSDIFSESAKTAKSEDWGYWTPALYLLSGDVAQSGLDLCPFASKGCRKNCLLVSGQREMHAHTAFEVTKQLRSGETLSTPTIVSLLRTYAYRFDPEFLPILAEQIRREQEKAARMDLRFAVRLNATSDLTWENSGIMQEFPEVIFYDYTKIPQRAMRYAVSEAPGFFGGQGLPYHEYQAENPPWPRNYHLSFSYSEVNMAWCLILLKMGVNVVIPFTGTLGKAPWEFDLEGVDHATDRRNWKPVLPAECFGYPVIDGDAYDIRFIDNAYWSKRLGVPPPFIVGLRVKGHYQRRHAAENAFFFDGQAAQEFGSDLGFVTEHLVQNMQEAHRQGMRGQIPSVALAEQYLEPEVFRAFQSAL